MPSDLETILKLDVPVIVRLGERIMPFDEIINWIPGSIVELEKDAEADLELMINNIAIAQGTAVKVGENFGIRISFVGDLDAKIAAMSENRPQITTEKEDETMTDTEAEDLAAMMLAGQL